MHTYEIVVTLAGNDEYRTWIDASSEMGALLIAGAELEHVGYDPQGVTSISIEVAHAVDF